MIKKRLKEIKTFVDLIRLNSSSRYVPVDTLGGGADRFLLKLYFEKFNRESLNVMKQNAGRGLPTMYDIFDDLMEVLKVADTLDNAEERSNGVEEMLVKSHRDRLQLHIKQFMFGRLLPMIKEVMGDRLMYLDEIFATTDDELTGREGFAELLRVARCWRSYGEEDYEDGVQWLKCLYTCK